MGVQDRDWYRKDYKERETKYGSDFSGNYHSTQIEKQEAEQKQEAAKKNEAELLAIAASFFGAVFVLFLYGRINSIWPIFIMLAYDLWMLIYVFGKKPKAGTKILAVLFFLMSAGLMCFMLYMAFKVPVTYSSSSL